MNRRPTRDYRPAGSRPLPSRRTTRPAPRPAPSHIARRESRACTCVGIGSPDPRGGCCHIVVWRVRRADNAEQAARHRSRRNRTGRTGSHRHAAADAHPRARCQRSVPGSSEHAADVARAGRFGEFGSQYPSAVSTADPQRLSTQEATPAQPPARHWPLLDGAPDGGPILRVALRLLEFVNVDRTAAGLPVACIDCSAGGPEHSEEMADLGYMSHWNLDGYGPEHRYSFVGGWILSRRTSTGWCIAGPMAQARLRGLGEGPGRCPGR